MTDSSSYIPKHSLAECEQFLVHPEHNRLKLKAETDPESKRLAEEWRREFVAHGLIADRKPWQNPDYRKRFDPVQHSEETVRLLASVPESETEKYFGSGQSSGGTDTPSKLAAERPDYYQLVRRAAIARGKIEDRPVQPVPQPKPASQFTVVPDEVCDRAGLPRGYQTTASGLETIRGIIKELAEKKAAAERLATVTAEKLERDARIDASVAEFGRLLDINREHAQKQRERDTAAVKETA